MTHLGRTAGAAGRTAAATFAQSLVDHRHLPAGIKLNGAVRAQTDAGLAPDADIRIDPGNRRWNDHFSPRSQGKRFGGRPGGLGDGVGDVFGRLTGAGDKNPVGGRVQWSELGVFFQEEPVGPQVDPENAAHLAGIRTGFNGHA